MLQHNIWYISILKIPILFKSEVSVISRYSGKYDLCDSLETHDYTLEELQNNVKIYVGNNPEPLYIKRMEDLMPFYPYLISSACYNNVDKKSVIHLSSESFVDREEREILEWKLKHLLRIYNRCKRKKIEFDVEEALNEVVRDGWNEKAFRELANRVKENGKKATVNGIHLKMHEHYRMELVSQMLKNNLNPLKYGDYQRFID